MLLSQLSTQIRFESHDVDSDTWTDAQLAQYLNDGVRQVCIVRPDAYISRLVFPLEANNPRQAFPAGTGRLEAITRNMGLYGTSAGNVVRKGDFASLEAVRPAWASDFAAEISNYFWEPWMGRFFFVHPHPNAAIYVEGMFTALPAAVALTADLPIDDQYAPAVKAWALHLLFSKEIDDPSAGARSKFFYDQFNALIGVKTQADTAFAAR